MRKKGNERERGEKEGEESGREAEKEKETKREKRKRQGEIRRKRKKGSKQVSVEYDRERRRGKSKRFQDSSNQIVLSYPCITPLKKISCKDGFEDIIIVSPAFRFLFRWLYGNCMRKNIVNQTKS